MTRHRHGLGAAGAGLLVCALVVACGGDTSGPDLVESSTSSAATPTPSDAESPVLPDPTAYLPAPEGADLTPQGSELAVRDTATVAWEPRQDLVGVLDVTVTRLQLTSFAESFEGWQLDEPTRRSTPYFVSVTVTNVGESDVGGRAVPLYAVDQDNTLIEASSFQAKFPPCPGNGVFPPTFGPGDVDDVCLVYLVPNRGELTAVSFRPVQEFDPITWTGPIKRRLRPEGP